MRWLSKKTNMVIKSSNGGVFILVAAFCVLLCASQGQTAPELSRQKLTNPDSILSPFEQGQETVKVIVNLAEPNEARTMNWHSRNSLNVLHGKIHSRQQAVLATLAKGHFSLRHRFDNQAGFSAEVTIEGLTRLANNPAVQSIEPVYELQLHLAQGIQLINGTLYRSTYIGQGVSIAICDSGIDYTHSKLGGGSFPNSKVIGGYDFGDDDSDPMPLSDAHGTCCAGIAAGNLGTVSNYIGGVAPDAKLYALKIEDSSGVMSTDDVIAAWDWCVTHKDDDPLNPILVISNSFGTASRFYSACNSEAGVTAANNVVAAGITLLASSGNDGYCDSIAWPACIGSVISVGAVYDAAFGSLSPCISAESCVSKTYSSSCDTHYYTTDTAAADKVTSYSNTASFLDILAPSNQTYTTDIAGSAGYSSGDYHSSFGGTSAACPYAAGAAACLQSAAKAATGTYLTPAEVKNILSSTGDSITDTKAAITKPRINLGRAINSLFQPPSANDVNVSTSLNTALIISLQASDDGLPNPPGVLSYIITSLPADGNISDPCAGGITSVPYTLTDNGSKVIYTPAVNFGGIDSFQYKANDGGAAPLGGDSVEAVVSIVVDPVTVEYQVSGSYDDAYASGSTAQNTTTNYLRVGLNSVAPYCMSAMRFTNLYIPNSASIINAKLKICSYASFLTNAVYGSIQGEDSDNAEDFYSRYISNITATAASVNWDHSDYWTPNTWYSSPDITDVIEEIVDRQGWSAGNALAITYSTRTASGSFRSFSSYDRGGTTYAPKLEITFIRPVMLTTSAGIGGSVTPVPGTFYYNRGDLADITATPASDYKFAGWTGSGVTSGRVANANLANTVIVMDANYSVQAGFTTIYDLNNDGSVGWPDVYVIADNWLSQGQGITGDLDENGIVNFLDFAEFTAVWRE